MIVFHSDLDNTLIYSYKRDIGSEKVCVEIYQDREISFMTDKSHKLLKVINDKLLFVPTTTRTVEQYNRIDLGVGIPKYALVCNGGVLLVDGQENEEWYRESLELIAYCSNELEKAEKLLEKDRYRSFEVRFIKSLFIFTKSEEPEKTVEWLSQQLDLNKVDVFNNGVKVYVVPKELSKGVALKRFKEKVKQDLTVAAGDSEFDVSMLKEADISLAPEKLILENKIVKCICAKEGEIFSDVLLEYIMSLKVGR